jgi:hypothetical protein
MVGAARRGDGGPRGFDAEGRRDRAWRGRNDDRNAAYADLLLSSGMRRTEAGSMLTLELPGTTSAMRKFYGAELAAAITKSRRGRRRYIVFAPLNAIET